MPAQYINTTTKVPTTRKESIADQSKSQTAILDADAGIAIEASEKGKDRAVGVDKDVQKMANANDLLPTDVSYQITLYTLDLAALSSPDFHPRTCLPQCSRVVFTTEVQDGDQVLAVILRLDKERKLGIRKYDMFFKLENLNLQTIASYELVEPREEDRLLEPWTKRVAEKGVRGRGEELPELVTYEFPEEKTLEAVGVILTCHDA